MKTARPPRIYGLEQMPRVDTHVHILHKNKAQEKKDTAKFLRVMSGSKIKVAIDLYGTREMVGRADAMRRQWKERLLFAPGAYFRVKVGELWWSKADLESFAEAGCAGTKIWVKYFPGLNKKSIIEKIQRQGELGLPVIGLHVSDPPYPGYWNPGYWDRIYEAEKVIRACPGTTFIMAHGFWLMNSEKGLDVLSGFFNRYPNLNVDLAAVYQWWNSPEPKYGDLRNFILRYKDRILYATDGDPSYSKKINYENTYRILETEGEHLHGFFTRPDAFTYIKGLALPVETLNYIYYWNAARLIPQVRVSLAEMGYDV